jgi:hypothetical protein
MADEAEFDPEALLILLAKENVEFLVIGGIAAALYGAGRTTYDLDIVPAPGLANARRLARALARAGARLRGVDADLLGLDPADPQQLAGGANWTLETDLGDLDLMPAAPGMRPWPQMAARARRVSLGEHEIALVDLDDLIAMKRAAGRRQDIQDIVALTVGAQQASEPAHVHVRLTARLSSGVHEHEALDAAATATSGYEHDVRRWVSGGEGTDPAGLLHVEAELPGFTEKHGETWAGVVAARLEASGICEGAVERRVRPR